MPIDYGIYMQERMDKAFEPINTLAEGKTKLALADLAFRQRQSEENARYANQSAVMNEAARIREKEAEADANRRRGEAEDRDRRMLYHEYVKMGIADISPSDSLEVLQQKFTKHMRNRSDSVIGSLSSQLEDANTAKQYARERLQNIISSSSTPAINRSALIAALSDPSSNVLNDKQRRELNDILMKGGDPDANVKAATKYITEAAWVPSWVPFVGDDSPARAQAFLDKYLTGVNANLDAQKKLDVDALTAELKSRETEGLAIRREMNDYITQNGGFLTDEAKARMTASGFGPHRDPYDNLKPFLTPAPATQAGQPGQTIQKEDAKKTDAAPAVTTPAPDPVTPEPTLETPTAAPGQQNVQLRAPMNPMAPGSAITPTQAQAMGSSLGALAGQGVDAATSRFMGEGADQLGTEKYRTSPISRQEVARNKVALLMKDPNLKPMQYSPSELLSVQQLAEQNYQGNPQEWAKTLAAVQRGQPVDDDSRRRIAAFNVVLTEYRNKMQAPGMMPLNQQTLAMPTP